MFGENDGYVIELISPMNRDGSPVDTVLKKNGNIPYHICYNSENLEKDIKDLKEKRYMEVIEPQEAIAFDNRRVAFMFNPSVGLIEIVEE